MTNRVSTGVNPVYHTDTSTSENTRILAVGDMTIWQQACQDVPVHRNVRFTDLDRLDAGEIGVFRPDLVVSPIVTPKFDCIDVAHRLAEISFTGTYRAFATDLPDPEIVQREVRALFPGLNFSVSQMPQELSAVA